MICICICIPLISCSITLRAVARSMTSCKTDPSPLLSFVVLSSSSDSVSFVCCRSAILEFSGIPGMSFWAIALSRAAVIQGLTPSQPNILHQTCIMKILTRLPRAIAANQGVALAFFQSQLGIGQNLQAIGFWFALGLDSSLFRLVCLVAGSDDDVDAINVELLHSSIQCSLV